MLAMGASGRAAERKWVGGGWAERVIATVHMRMVVMIVKKRLVMKRCVRDERMHKDGDTGRHKDGDDRCRDGMGDGGERGN